MASSSTTPVDLPTIPSNQLIKMKEYAVASGGYGQVFQCIMRPPAAPETLVAVKVLMCLTGDTPKLKHARREMKLWMEAKHDNIVPMLGITEGFSEEGFAMVSPWVNGGTLARYLQVHAGKIHSRKKLTLLKDITQGLAYLHSRQIIHGDLTTNNIMLDDNDKAMLIDFGLSNVLGGIDGSCLTPSPARPGAVRFAAPELLGVEEAISQPTGETSPMPNMCSDIYSLGCVMLNVLTEQSPWHRYRDLTFLGALHAQKPIPIPAHSHLSDERKKLIYECTSVQANRRPSSQYVVNFIEAELYVDYTLTEMPNNDDPPVINFPSRKYNIVVAGSIGSGKSSLVNLLCGEHVAQTSNNAGRCTEKWMDYQTSFCNTEYRVFDTVGFACSNMGPEERPGRYENLQIGEIHEQSSIDLLLLCVPSRNFHFQAVLDVHKRIQDQLHGRHVPIVLVFTHYEERSKIDSWWSKNLSTLQAQLNSITNHLCITSIDDKCLDDSRKQIFHIVAQHRTSDVGELWRQTPALGDVHSAQPLRGFLGGVARARIKQFAEQVHGVVTRGFGLLPHPS
ncbi:kinase-like domain-containing protein [Suillus cothurnatus]|nr:kinase-like domain-containing protein [Suillus cothurnatus]